jgi:hypothetical protein
MLDWKMQAGKIHRQLEGPDRREYSVTARVERRPLTLAAIVPADLPSEAVLAELAERGERIVAMFNGTPFLVSYDGLSEAEPDIVSAHRHTAEQLAEG